jgi:CRISPR-associated protein (TIGR03986 family)
MWIKTEIKEVFRSGAGLEMIRFTAAKGGGQLWAAPADLVRSTLGMDELVPGERVEIQIEGGQLLSVSPPARPQDGGRQPGQRPPSGVPRRAPGRSGATSTMAKTIPYGFAHIDTTKRAVADTPVLHDGSGSDGRNGGELLSGEILCSLTALTPLLAGNARYQRKKADDQKLSVWGLSGIPQEKQIAEPLRLKDGRVLIAGSALKGMFRMSLSALFSTPMERVRERHFTYRPNLGHVRTKPRLECRPAVVRSISQSGMAIDILPAQSAIFVHSTNVAKVLSARTAGTLVNDSVKGVFLDTDPRTGQKRLKDDRNDGPPFTLQHYVFFYAGGMDGIGTMAEVFNGKRTHREALVPRDDVINSAKSAQVSKEVFERYCRTQQVLADNDAGHLAKSHPLAANLKAKLGDKWAEKEGNTILAAAELRVNQLIFVEVEEQGGVPKVQSLGHNYQYRSAYTSSVREKNGQLRDCLVPTADEKDSEADGRPRALTAARLLFGYVHDEQRNPIGKGAFQRLAGRIAINHAVSAKDPQFLGEENRGYCVPLAILGQPKPSAWEFYLRQDASKPVTYGDLPGDPGGDLAGRKYYRHQPAVQKLKDIKAEPKAEESDQATIARCICVAGTKFKFAVRFARLREWELGALMVVLTPELLGETGTTYAHKLGLGRPLGMGSARVKIDQMLVRRERDAKLPGDENRADLEARVLHALKTRLSEIDYGPWLKMHTFVSVGHVGYPEEQAKRRDPGDPTIYDWHTNRRREYSEARRMAEPARAWSVLREQIRKVKRGEA